MVLETSQQKPVVSVIVPVYNVEQYLPDCVESLLAQTLQNIELIFVDDKSTDNSLSMLYQYQEQHPDKIRVIESEVNARQGAARNKGIRASQAEYILFMDSDDLAAPTLLERLYQEAIRTDADVAFCRQYYVKESFSVSDCLNNPSDLILEVSADNGLLAKWSEKELDAEAICDMIAAQGGIIGGALIKRKLFLEHEIFFPEKVRYEDNFLHSLLLAYLQKIVFVPKMLYYYRIHEASTVHVRNDAFQYEDRIKIEQQMLEQVKQRGLFEPYQAAWEYLYAFRYGMNTCFIIVKQFDDVPVDVINGIVNDLNKQFPEWKKNKYWNTLISKSAKKKFDFLMANPKLFVSLLQMKHKIKKS